MSFHSKMHIKIHEYLFIYRNTLIEVFHTPQQPIFNIFMQRLQRKGWQMTGKTKTEVQNSFSVLFSIYSASIWKSVGGIKTIILKDVSSFVASKL